MRATLVWVSLATVIAFQCSLLATSYYVHPTRGDDRNTGTSAGDPWRTLSRASRATLQPGDRVLLAAGERFEGELRYEGVSGNAQQRVVIGSYATEGSEAGKPPLIDARGHLAGVYLKDSRYVELRDLAITANAGGQKNLAVSNSMRCGVLIEATRAGEYPGLSLTNLHIRDVFFEEEGFSRGPEEVKTANGTQRYGWGVRFIIKSPLAALREITVSDCRIENVSHTGLKFTAPSNRIEDVRVQRLKVLHTGGPGVQMSGMRRGHFSELYVNGSGSTNDTRNWGRGSGLWTWGSSDVVIERSHFLNANGPADSAGVHIDFNCRNVVVQYNVSANNAGGFFEVLGNNYNCAYRYNLSINDGHRVKGRNGAFQEGKVFWLSGYAGNKSPRRGPFNTYFYNNTIYVGEDQVANIAFAPTAQGVLIANNIFCFQGRSKLVTGDQFRPDSGEIVGLERLVFANNLFLRAENWPLELPVRDRSPLVGDPLFVKGGGLRIEDYIPRAVELVKDRGIVIARIPQDEIGLAVGLEVERDLPGNLVRGLPDLGAIELR